MKGWLHTPIEDEVLFNEQVAGLCQLYHDAPMLHANGIPLISCDEKTGIQASDTSHNIQFVYTPKHASWLNQVEIWFGILVNRLLKRLSVKSTDELKIKILSFISYFNQTMAKAFKWTYKGKVLKA